MSELSCRNLIRGAAVASAAVAAASITKAGAASADVTSGAGTASEGKAGAAGAGQANGRYGDLRDIRHVVILMQENRSFDMYFGTLAGVIGYADKAAITLPGGYSVFE